MVPALFTVNANAAALDALSKVLAKLMAAVPSAERVVSLPIKTAPLYVCAPFVLTDPPLMLVIPATVNDPVPFVIPVTAPFHVTVSAVSTASPATLTAPLNVIVLNGTATLPSAPAMLITPWVPAVKVTVCVLAVVPLTPLENVILAPVASVPLLVVSNKVLVAVSTTGLLNNIDDGPLVLTIGPVNVVLNALVSKCNGAAP